MNVRPKHLLTILALAIVLGVQAQGCNASKSVSKSPPQAATSTSVPLGGVELGIVKGSGDSPEKAEHKALEKARDLVLTYLKQQNLEGSAPSLEALRQEGFVTPVPLDDDQKASQDPWCNYRVTLSAGLWKQLVQQEQGVLKVERQWLAVKVFGVLMALVLAIGGYFYLDEATKGYYTVLLRLAALTLVGTVGLVIWLAVH